MIRWFGKVLQALLATHNQNSGGCRYFAASFDSLDERCDICE